MTKTDSAATPPENTNETPSNDYNTVSHKNKWWTLGVVCVATFMLLLDVTVVNVAIKSIQQDLKGTFSDSQWIVDAYALTLASLLLTFGSLGDRYGRKVMFTFGVVCFTLTSLMCAMAASPMMLNISRALQGIGAGAMFTTALPLLAQEFRGKERGTAFGAWGAVTGGAVAIGPLIGGALVSGVGWRSIFYVNVPIGILTVALTLWKVTDTHERVTDGRVDLPGFITFSLAGFCWIFALVRGNFDGWTSSVILTSFAIGTAALLAFIVIELKSKHAMLDFALFRKPTFIGASIAAFTISASIFSAYLYITLYLQISLQLTPWQTGLRFLPNSLLSFVVAAAAGKLSSKYAPRWFLSVGLALIGIGLLTMTAISPTSDWTAILPGLVIAGFGTGMSNPALASTAVGVVPPRKAGVASGINGTFRQIGIATGIAGLGALFQHLISTRTTDHLSAIPSIGAANAHEISHASTGGTLADTLNSMHLEPQLQGQVIGVLRESFVYSMDRIVCAAAAIAFFGAIASLVLIRKQDFEEGSAHHASQADVA